MSEVVELHEREVRSFPRDRFVAASGQSLVFPEVRDLSAFEIKDTADGVSLRVLGLIGYLPVTPDVALNLRPKFPTDNLWYMLDEADDTYRLILPTARSYEKVGQDAPHQLLARAFAHFVRDLLASGFARRYVAERVTGYFRPKVAIAATIAGPMAKGDHVKTISDVFTFTTDIRVNGLIKTACRHFLATMPRTVEWADDRRCLMEALDCLARVSERDITPADLNIGSEIPARFQPFYLGALTAYGIYRGLTKIGFEYAPQGARLPSFLFCLDDIFEAFVRNMLRKGLRDAGVSVADGNKRRNQKSLFRDNATYPVKPDCIFKSGNEFVGLGEIKYKPKIDEADRYQLLSHTLASSAPLGIWFSPAPSPEAEGMQYVGNFAEKARFYHYRLDLSGNLKASVIRMVESVAELLTREP